MKNKTDAARCIALMLLVVSNSAKSLNKSFVTTNAGKYFEVQMLTVNGEQPRKLEGAALRMLLDFEEYIVRAEAIPKSWIQTIRSKRFHIRITDESTSFVARVIDEGGIEIQYQQLVQASSQIVLRHELFHLMRRRLGILANPEWVEEGLAQYFALESGPGGGVGYPLQAFLGSPDADLRLGSRDSKHRTHAWYGKSFLLIYYLIYQSASDRAQRLKNFWALANLSSKASDDGPTGFLRQISRKLPANFKHTDQAYLDFLLAAASNRGLGVFFKKYFLFPTTLELSFAKLAAASAGEQPCVSRFFESRDDSVRLLDDLRSWQSAGFQIVQFFPYPGLPLELESIEGLNPRSEEAFSSRRRFLMYCAE